MRRFINSLPGKVIAQLVSAALILPFTTLVLVTRSEAQLQALPSMAVVDFVNNAPAGAPAVGDIGGIAADSVANEFAKRGTYDVIPQETVRRALTTLGLQSPVTSETSLLRLSQELRANFIVTGNVVNYRIVTENGGKHADILMRILVRDAASNLPINGSALSASSSVRTTDVADETLVKEAFTVGAARAVQDIAARALPQATVLNTVNDQALINKGSRSGFKVGQKVIISRGRQQVGRATISEVDFDSAYAHLDKMELGLQPGDKMTVVFEVPQVEANWSKTGDAKVVKSKVRGSNSSFMQLIMVVALGALLFGGGRGNNQTPVNNVRAEAGMFILTGPAVDPNGYPGVKISWEPDIFVKGNANRYKWQVWRNDTHHTPVVVVDGTQRAGFDNTSWSSFTFYDFGGVIGGSTCLFTAPPAVTLTDSSTTGTDSTGTDSTGTDSTGTDSTGSDPTELPPQAPTPGQAYQYSVELVYKLLSLDLPGTTSSGGGSSTGTTGSSSTGSSSTGSSSTGSSSTGSSSTGSSSTGTTSGGTTSGGSGSECYFVSGRAFAKGLATALIPGDHVNPLAGSFVSGPTTFSWDSSADFGAISIEYIVQLSTLPNFPRSSTVTLVQPFISAETAEITSPNPVDVSGYFPGVTTLWWRVGARNIIDKPGPVRDTASGLRYVFGSPTSFTR